MSLLKPWYFIRCWMFYYIHIQVLHHYFDTKLSVLPLSITTFQRFPLTLHVVLNKAFLWPGSTTNISGFSKTFFNNRDSPISSKFWISYTLFSPSSVGETITLSDLCPCSLDIQRIYVQYFHTCNIWILFLCIFLQERICLLCGHLLAVIDDLRHYCLLYMLFVFLFLYLIFVLFF